MSTNTKQLCRYLAGSHSYGLDTITSDIDLRGVHITLDVGEILDPHIYTGRSNKVENKISDGVDTVSYEFRHFLHILRNANTNAVELMFNKKWTSRDYDTFITFKFKKVLDHRTSLLDPHKFYKSLKGYILNETRLAVGERTGKLGGKRYEQLQKYGYSPKNFVQLLRLTFAGRTFFRTGQFPLDIRDYYNIHPLLMEIKCHPERFTKENLTKLVNIHETLLDKSYEADKDNIAKMYRFDENVATALIFDMYKPVLDLFNLAPNSGLTDKPWYKRLFHYLTSKQ